MRESLTYQAILQDGRSEGEVVGARKLLRVRSAHRFGAADAVTVAALDAITDLAQLEALGERMASAHSWQELLGPRAPGSRRRPTP